MNTCIYLQNVFIFICIWSKVFSGELCWTELRRFIKPKIQVFYHLWASWCPGKMWVSWGVSFKGITALVPSSGGLLWRNHVEVRLGASFSQTDCFRSILRHLDVREHAEVIWGVPIEENNFSSIMWHLSVKEPRWSGLSVIWTKNVLWHHLVAS